MKSVIIYLAGAILFLPCIFVCSDNIVGVICGLIWGVLLWHSPKFSPVIRKFWLKFYKTGLRMINSIL